MTCSVAADFWVARRALKQPNDALAHLARGFVGEGNCEDVLGCRAVAHNLEDAVRNDARLPRARARQDQERPFSCFNCLALCLVE